MRERFGENNRRTGFLRHVPQPCPRLLKGRKARRAGEIALMTARHHAKTSVPLGHIAQRVFDDQQFGADLSVGDLIADPGLPRHCTTVQLERPSAFSHEHRVTVVVTELITEKVGEIRDDARVADQLPKWFGKTV